jgi:hypothetical protein
MDCVVQDVPDFIVCFRLEIKCCVVDSADVDIYPIPVYSIKKSDVKNQGIGAPHFDNELHVSYYKGGSPKWLILAIELIRFLDSLRAKKLPIK